MHSHRIIHRENRIINMTGQPIHLYEDMTGVIEVFYPSAWAFCGWRHGNINLPESACYVFMPEMEDEICWFKSHCFNVAVVIGHGVGRDGIEITNLKSLDDDERVVFRRGL